MATYVFANQNGGVGKTTITLGIAAALARGPSLPRTRSARAGRGATLQERGARAPCLPRSPAASTVRGLTARPQSAPHVGSWPCSTAPYEPESHQALASRADVWLLPALAPAR